MAWWLRQYLLRTCIYRLHHLKLKYYIYDYKYLKYTRSNTINILLIRLFIKIFIVLNLFTFLRTLKVLINAVLKKEKVQKK